MNYQIKYTQKRDQTTGSITHKLCLNIINTKRDQPMGSVITQVIVKFRINNLVIKQSMLRKTSGINR